MPMYVVDSVAEALNRRRRCLNGAGCWLSAWPTSVESAISGSHPLWRSCRCCGREAPTWRTPTPMCLGGNRGRRAEGRRTLSSSNRGRRLRGDPDGSSWTLTTPEIVRRPRTLVIDTRGATWGIPDPEQRVVTLLGDPIGEIQRGRHTASWWAIGAASPSGGGPASRVSALPAADELDVDSRP